LVKAGAIHSDRAPIGKTWSVDVGTDTATFVINLHGLSHAECDFFATAIPNWATEMFVNKYRIEDTVTCFSNADNDISFTVR
jgi:hypothetical protein